MDLPQVSSQPPKKRRRGSNWSLNETLLLIELYKQRAHIIRKKPYDVGFYKPAIIKAWEEIASLLGQHPSKFKRSVKECRKRWCTVQTTAKTNLHKGQQGLTLGKNIFSI
ncbi:hypothetical protein E2C01_082076 [Portunus trituberculatus]|uniref:Regulatory protein zeste n=1 Tax=Portunus trituberculatus TaxID=210409 RepID=A0A5B7IRF2_PORTR|nr:hypothetical protein [Portunus trituberculatus]